MIGLIVFSMLSVAAVTALSMSLYAALPTSVLEQAERHGRFLGLHEHETLAKGTRVGEPPMGATAVQVG